MSLHIVKSNADKARSYDSSSRMVLRMCRPQRLPKRPSARSAGPRLPRQRRTSRRTCRLLRRLPQLRWPRLQSPLVETSLVGNAHMETNTSLPMMPFLLPRPRLSPRPKLAPKKVPEAEAPGHRRSRDPRDLLTPGRQKRRSILCAFGMALTRDAGEGTLAPTSMVDSHSKAPGRLTWMRVSRYMRPRKGKSNGWLGNPWTLTRMRVYRYMRPRTGKLNGRLTWMRVYRYMRPRTGKL